MKKRLISSLVALSMAVGMLPTVGFAQGTTDSGLTVVDNFIYANGNTVVFEGGVVDGETSIYIDGLQYVGDINGDSDGSYNLSDSVILGGMNGDVAESAKITVNGGNIGTIYAGGDEIVTAEINAYIGAMETIISDFEIAFMGAVGLSDEDLAQIEAITKSLTDLVAEFEEKLNTSEIIATEIIALLEDLSNEITDTIAPYVEETSVDYLGQVGEAILTQLEADLTAPVKALEEALEEALYSALETAIENIVLDIFGIDTDDVDTEDLEDLEEAMAELAELEAMLDEYNSIGDEITAIQEQLDNIEVVEQPADLESAKAAAVAAISLSDLNGIITSIDNAGTTYSYGYISSWAVVTGTKTVALATDGYLDTAVLLEYMQVNNQDKLTALVGDDLDTTDATVIGYIASVVASLYYLQDVSDIYTLFDIDYDSLTTNYSNYITYTADGQAAQELLAACVEYIEEVEEKVAEDYDTSDYDAYLEEVAALEYAIDELEEAQKASLGSYYNDYTLGDYVTETSAIEAAIYAQKLVIQAQATDLGSISTIFTDYINGNITYDEMYAQINAEISALTESATMLANFATFVSDLTAAESTDEMLSIITDYLADLDIDEDKIEDYALIVLEALADEFDQDFVDANVMPIFAAMEDSLTSFVENWLAGEVDGLNSPIEQIEEMIEEILSSLADEYATADSIYTDILDVLSVDDIISIIEDVISISGSFANANIQEIIESIETLITDCLEASGYLDDIAIEFISYASIEVTGGYVGTIYGGGYSNGIFVLKTDIIVSGGIVDLIEESAYDLANLYLSSLIDSAEILELIDALLSDASEYIDLLNGDTVEVWCYSPGVVNNHDNVTNYYYTADDEDVDDDADISKEIIITFDAGSGTSSVTTAYAIAGDTLVTAYVIDDDIEVILTDLPTATRSGYTLEGWYDGDDKVYFDTTVFEVDTTLTASWSKNTSSSSSSSTITTTTSGSSSSTAVTMPITDNSTFSDVVSGDYYVDAITWAVENDITNGVSTTEFGVGQLGTREQVMTFLWRLAGEPSSDSEHSFTDLEEDEYYYEAILWAVENGITNGVTEELFGVGLVCTRAQIVTFLYRYAGEPSADAYGSFIDVADDAYYADAVAWAVENGITNGYTDDTFAPDDACTREQIVTFLYRYATM